MKMIVVFEKAPRLRHIGHLDLMRAMQRALRRSHLPVQYSKGFNPHMNMSFASALSSGIPGDAEILDVSLAEPVTEEEALQALRMALPAAMPVTRVRLVDDRFKKMGAKLEAAAYVFTLHTDSETAARLLEDPKQSITEVMYACGFSNSASFSTMFKNMFGMSPRDYQRSKM